MLGSVGDGAIIVTSEKSGASTTLGAGTDKPRIASEGDTLVQVRAPVEANLELPANAKSTSFVSDATQAPIRIPPQGGAARFSILPVADGATRAPALRGLAAQDVQTVSVSAGTLQLPAASLPSAMGEPVLYRGETALFDRNGQLLDVVLGSDRGESELAGDRLKPPALAGLSVEQSAPRLAALSERLGEAPREFLRAQLLADKLTLLDEINAFGRMMARGSAGQLYAGIPIGRVGLDLGQQRGSLNSGNGAVVFFRDSVSITIAPALADLVGWVSHVHKQGGKLTLRADDSYLLERKGEKRQLQAGLTIGAGSSAGEGRDAAGRLTWTDGQGRTQTLYAAVEHALLLAEARRLDGQAELIGCGDGSFQLRLGGKAYELIADELLVAVPVAQANAPWWIGSDGLLYLRYPALGLAQRFRVR